MTLAQSPPPPIGNKSFVVSGRKASFIISRFVYQIQNSILTFQNQHDLTPRVDFSGQQWEPELMVDGVPTMKLPWFFSTTEFWLQPLNQTTFTLKSERIRDALNSTDIDFLCQEELHKHIGQIFPQGPSQQPFKPSCELANSFRGIRYRI